jgi:hypothetical protein
MPLVSITRLRIRSWRFLPMFLLYGLRSSRQATRAEGSLAVVRLSDRHRVFWTATVWSSEAAMKRFMVSGIHGRAMRKLLHWCDEASVVHWTQESESLPSWQEAHRRLLSEGRPSKVHHPSKAHENMRFPEPNAASSATRFK